MKIFVEVGSDKDVLILSHKSIDFNVSKYYSLSFSRACNYLFPERIRYRVC